MAGVRVEVSDTQYSSTLLELAKHSQPEARYRHGGFAEPRPRTPQPRRVLVGAVGDSVDGGTARTPLPGRSFAGLPCLPRQAFSNPPCGGKRSFFTTIGSFGRICFQHQDQSDRIGLPTLTKTPRCGCLHRTDHVGTYRRVNARPTSRSLPGINARSRAFAKTVRLFVRHTVTATTAPRWGAAGPRTRNP